MLYMAWQHLLGEFRKESGIDLSNDSLAMQRLREAAEKVSRERERGMEWRSGRESPPQATVYEILR